MKRRLLLIGLAVAGVVVIGVFALVVSTGPAAADGCYVPPLKLDSKSHSRDITEPSQKAIICHFDGHEKLVIQVSYKGDVNEFCWLVPTPAKPEVSIVETPVFHALHEATAPRVKYWLDADRALGSGLWAVYAQSRGGESVKLQVEVIERKQIGDYDVSVLRANNADDLTTWLKSNGYYVTDRYTRIFDEYLKRGWVFTAAKIVTTRGDAVSAKLKEGILAPLRLDFDCPKPIYPLRISSLNPGTTKLLLYTLSDHRLRFEGFKTECAMDLTRPPRERWPYVYNARRYMFDLVGDRWHRPITLTKLSADMSPAHMTKDIVFTPAKTDESVEPPYASPGFIENFGAASMLILAFPLVMPFNLITCVVVLALSPFGRTERIRNWHYVIAVAVFFAPIPVSVVTPLFSNGLGHLIVGTALLLAIAAGLAHTLLHGRRRVRRSSKQEG